MIISLNLLVRLDAQVYPGVLREVTRIGEGFVALSTFVRLGLSHVNLGVQLQISFGAKNLQK